MPVRTPTAAVGWLPLVARVEWYSGCRGAERPATLLCGAERLALEVVTESVEGSAVAGEPVLRSFIARDTAGRLLRIRASPDGATSVEVAVGGRLGGGASLLP